MKRVKIVLSVIAILMVVSRVYGVSSSDGEQIVGRHSFVINGPAGGASGGMASGPIIGNGDVGIMLSGPADALTFYIGKNDSWSSFLSGIRDASALTVGRMRIMTPALQGATLKTTVDMQHAELRGEYAKANASLASRSWVDANRNLLCVELVNTGTAPLAMTLQNITASNNASILLPASVEDNGVPIQLGCEQGGGGRWFFNGEMADVAVLDQVLSDADIAKLAQGERKEVKVFDGKTRLPLAAPGISKALSISAWIKAAKRSPDANYILSKGEFHQGYSLGLSGGRVRFAIGGVFLQCDEQVPLDKWVHVAGTYDGKRMALLLDGKLVKAIARPSDPGAPFLFEPDAPNPALDSRKIAVATRIVGNAVASSFTLEPGKTVVVVAAILSDLDCQGQDLLAEAKSLTAALTPDKIAEYGEMHRQWWQTFWSKSSIEIPDKVLEQHWYSALYIMASCSRAGKVAPGLWGNWITTDAPGWHGDFHLNYNFQAPFYGLYAANHPETTLPFYDAMNQAIPLGRRCAERAGWKGIHFPVSMGPWGLCPEGEAKDHGQRSNAAYCALNFIWYYQYTQDKDWLKHSGYQFLREVADFWENYLKFENGRYVIHNDSMHEGSGEDMNPLLSLGLVRTLFKNMLVMSADLGVDENRRAKWQDICEKISPFPTQERNGKTVFRYTEKGMDWCDNNTLGIQHIFPAGAIGLDSDPKLLEISRNMVDAMARWEDGNGSSSWYTFCARIGYDPQTILTRMRQMTDRNSMPNKLLTFGGGGIENVAGFHGITEMLLQSHDGVLRLFPCWPKDQDARFGGLRTVGAFLISAEMKNGVVSGVKILSEKGRDCTVVNPWPGSKVALVRNGRRPGSSAETKQGERFSFRTAVNETIELSPEQ
ncbi:MAG: hypothetical protein NTY65_00720 [Planctomycetota bacterium]|nr:hypothetical protein [Planctomycetota bacterium]